LEGLEARQLLSGAGAGTSQLLQGYGKVPLSFEANQGQTGLAFGVANNTTLNVFQMLKAVNKLSTGGKGVLYKGNATLRSLAAQEFEDMNERRDG
jgi:hypothetical protein